jgi:hypothetical protein
MTRILAFALGLAAGIYIGLRLVYTQEPADDGWQERGQPDDDWATDPYPVTLTVAADSPWRVDCGSTGRAETGA